MDGNIFPHLHVHFLDVQMLQTCVDQQQVALKSRPPVHHHPHYLNQDLVAELMDLVHVGRLASVPHWLQLILAGLGCEELLFLSHQGDELQEDLHHETALGNEVDSSPSCNFPDSDIWAPSKHLVDRFPQKEHFFLQILHVLLVVRVVNFYQIVRTVPFHKPLVLLALYHRFQQVCINQDQQESLLRVALRLLEPAALWKKILLNQLVGVGFRYLMEYFESRSAETSHWWGQVLVGVVDEVVDELVLEILLFHSLNPDQDRQPLDVNEAGAADKLLFIWGDKILSVWRGQPSSSSHLCLWNHRAAALPSLSYATPSHS